MWPMIGRDDGRGHGHGDRGRRDSDHRGFFRQSWPWYDYGYSYPYPSPYYPVAYTIYYPYPYYVNRPPLPMAAAPQEMTMNGYNPYYPYTMVGQDEALSPAMPGLPPGAIVRPGFPGTFPGGFVPVTGYPVPALATNLPTRRVLGEVDIVDTPATALAPVMGIVPRTELLPGFLHSSEKVCGKSCKELKLKNCLPFRIERLWVDGHDACDFEIKMIAIGQRILSTGRGFKAKYLKRGHDRRSGCRFDFVVDIDNCHPLRIFVENKSHKSRRLRVVAWGRQLAE